MENFKPRIRAVALVVRGEEILLMHRFNNGKEYYVFPGGGVEAEETVEGAVIREIHEESSLEIELEQLLYHHVYDDGSEQFFYLCTWISGEPKLGEGNEAEEMAAGEPQVYEPGWYPINGIDKLLLYPLEIRDWFLEDRKTNFRDTPREAYLKVAEIRQTL